MFAVISMKRIIKSSLRLHFYFHICCYFSSSLWCLINLVSSFLLPDRMFRYLFSFSPTLSPLPGFDQEWFPAHWFAAFRGVNCVILRILPWHGSRGRGWWGKRDLNGGARDKGALPSCEHCFFKSIFSMADGRGHSSGLGGGGFWDLCNDAEWGGSGIARSRLPRLCNSASTLFANTIKLSANYTSTCLECATKHWLETGL